MYTCPCVYVLEYLYMPVKVLTIVEARGGDQVSPFSSLDLVFLRQDLSFNLDLTNLAILTS